MGLYDDLSQTTKNILLQYAASFSRFGVHSSTESINNSPRAWMSIIQPYLDSRRYTIYATSGRYYYKQADIDNSYPALPGTDYILSPFGSSGRENAFTIMFVETSTGTKIYDYANSLIKARPNEYIDKQNIAVALTEDKFHKVKVVVKEEKVWILTSKLTDKLVQTTYTLFPFIFEIRELIDNENIKNCFRAATKDEPIKPYIEAIFGNLDTIAERKQKEALRKALKSKQNGRIRELDNAISSAREAIREREDRITSLHRQIEDALNEKFGLENRESVTDEKVDEIMEYVKNNQYIRRIEIDDMDAERGIIKLDLLAPITIYEPEPLERMIENYMSSPDLNEKVKYIYKALLRIFKDEELQMYCQTNMMIDLTDVRINAKHDTEYSYDEFDYLFQPHVTIFNCWGENENGIKQAIREGDFLGMINNIIIAIQNINFTDSYVFNRLISNLKNVPYWYELKTCKSKADGELWSIRDIVEQLKREDKAEETEEIGQPELEDTIPF